MKGHNYKVVWGVIKPWHIGASHWVVVNNLLAAQVSLFSPLMSLILRGVHHTCFPFLIKKEFKECTFCLNFCLGRWQLPLVLPSTPFLLAIRQKKLSKKCIWRKHIMLDLHSVKHGNFLSIFFFVGILIHCSCFFFATYI